MTTRNIDALVAEHVMGWKWFKDPDNFKPAELSYGENRYIPHFSTNITEAWRVVGKMDTYEVGRESWFSIRKLHEWLVGIEMYDDDRVESFFDIDRSAVHESAPMAICLAALKIKGVKVET